ncbi:hypothetical protein CI109_100043 [Kwoniella shandongensis]|uniref:Uncharacterized protein n=1 Tax=Kwoniella shandongensis TaxID=1734106 RepID=A0A5M6BS56_9TREE|nr:uncharacterized protein CI109_005984 [Kwoniella shandongensis]KAA5525676.1 hypothetical protein CI109_005984 [Kwoniella shandongensis]
MAFCHPEYLGPSIVALVLALYPLPWHLRTGNIATLSMIFWMTALNIVHTVNCVVWAEDSELRANVWGDISTTVIVAYNFALPTAHLLLAKQLESYTSLRTHSPLYDPDSRRRHRLFDLSMSIAAPVVGTLVHLSNMDRRFYVVEAFGPMPSTYWDTWGVIWMAIVPIVIAIGCLIYTIMALVNIYLRRQRMLSLIASDASVNRDQFYRLMFLTLAELGTCGLRAIFNLLSFQHGPQPLGHFGAPFHNLSRIESVPATLIAKTGRLSLNLSFFTVVACSIVFFLCFATSIETKRFYYNVVRYIFPCIPERPYYARTVRLGSADTGLSGSTSQSNASSSSLAPLSYSFTKPSGARCDGGCEQKDISLGEMLGTPICDKSGKYVPREQKYDEEIADALYLPPMQTEEKVFASARRTYVETTTTEN